MGQSWEEEPEELYQINNAKTRGSLCWTLGWCVGSNTPLLAKLPLTPLFFCRGFPHW